MPTHHTRPRYTIYKLWDDEWWDDKGQMTCNVVWSMVTFLFLLYLFAWFSFFSLLLTSFLGTNWNNTETVNMRRTHDSDDDRRMGGETAYRWWGDDKDDKEKAQETSTSLGLSYVPNLFVPLLFIDVFLKKIGTY